MVLHLDQVCRSCSDSDLQSRQGIRNPALDTWHAACSLCWSGMSWGGSSSLEVESAESPVIWIESHWACWSYHQHPCIQHTHRGWLDDRSLDDCMELDWPSRHSWPYWLNQQMRNLDDCCSSCSTGWWHSVCILGIEGCLHQLDAIDLHSRLHIATDSCISMSWGSMSCSWIHPLCLHWAARSCYRQFLGLESYCRTWRQRWVIDSARLPWVDQSPRPNAMGTFRMSLAPNSD